MEDLAASGLSLPSLMQLRPIQVVDMIRVLREVPADARFLLLLGMDEFNKVCAAPGVCFKKNCGN